MAVPLRVLILEDRAADAELMIRELRRHGFSPTWQRVETEEDYVASLDPLVDLVLADYCLPRFDALQALQLLQERGIDAAFVVITGSRGEEDAVECIKRGAADYLLKERLSRLGPAVDHALTQKRLREQNRLAAEELRKARDELEERVEERTAALEREIGERWRIQGELEVANEELRTLASELSLTEERERRRIATQLHDSVGQTLAFARIKLEALRTANRDQASPQAWEELERLLGQAISETRSMSFELSTPLLYELGFEAALEWLAEHVTEHYGLACKFEDDGAPKQLPEDLRVLLFQSVRELLINAAKHSGAERAKVSVGRRGKRVRVIVEDDGVGFEPLPADAGGRSGFGLFSIRERLALLSGRLEIDSKPGRGTRVVLEAPLPAVLDGETKGA